MKTPTWQEVGIPKVVVENLRTLKPGFSFDTLVYQTVFHYTKKLVLAYNCDECTYVHMPTKTTDEVSQCPSCFSKRVRCVQSLKFNKTSKVPMYSRKSPYMETIVRQMLDNFTIYFKQRADRAIDWEWHNDLFHVAFAGGDTASDPKPSVAITRAALMTPYLWDKNFDWKNAEFVDKVNKHFITDLLGHLTPPRRD